MRTDLSDPAIAMASHPAIAPARPVVELDRIVHGFGRHTVVDGLSFSLARGTIACLLGPSGCGKTTVLRAIAGFETLRGGEIRLDGEVVSSAGRGLPPEQRRIGMVFQDYALFPHLDIAANVGFGLVGDDRATRAARVREMLALVGLHDAGGRYPHELSGGQQQRVALARALAPRPALLLLDEPFSNLDIDLRERLGQEVRDILRAQGATAILVTHDQHEAFAMADEIGVMHGGRIEQWGDAHALYHQPATRFVAGFVGQGVLLPGRVRAPGEIALSIGTLPWRNPLALADGAGVDVLIRPDDLVYDDGSPLRGRVRDRAFRGASILYTVELADTSRVLALVPSHHDLPVGAPLGLRLEADDVVAFPRSSTL
ncbi:ABC transporter ATP-binding protein [Cupriavidus sp. OTU4054]|uniref:ABC transporter ATP-binding protein n=1 Tax=unclassified Cupriavidus TaxID=2640874 RepID=UPI00406CDF9C